MAGQYEGATVYPEIVIAETDVEADVHPYALGAYVGIARTDGSIEMFTADGARRLAEDIADAAEPEFVDTLRLHARVADISLACRDAAVVFAELGDMAPLEHALDHAFEEGLRDSGITDAPSAELFDSVRDSAIFAGGMATLGADATGHTDPTAAGLAVMIATAYRAGLDANGNAPS